MRKALISVAVAMLLTVSIGGSALARGTDAASGGGWFDNGSYEFKFNFHAKTLPDGSARGELRWWNHELGLVHTMTVSCLEVDGDEALIGGTITRSTDPWLLGESATMPVKDGGEGAEAEDMAGWVTLEAAPCSEKPDYVEVIKGNIQVKDR